MANKHFRPDETPVDLSDDLHRHPGIGQPKGLLAMTSAADMNLIQGRTRSRETRTTTRA